jgi:hypothetical protein
MGICSAGKRYVSLYTRVPVSSNREGLKALITSADFDASEEP